MAKYILLLFCVFSFSPLYVSDSNPLLDFLNALDASQLEKTQFPFEADTRETWHFFPASMWQRPGIPLSELKENQIALFHKALQGYLSRSGYEKTMQIIELENVLAALSGNTVMRDAKKYHIAVYGNPKKDKVWGWSFEGHHLSLNFSIVNDQISYTPRFFGASPAVIKSGPRKGERTLVKEEDLALQLIQELNPEQREKAIFRKDPYREIVTGRATTVSPLETVGITLSLLTKEQKMLLTELIYEYLSAMPQALAAKRMANLKKEEFDHIHFGWAGATELGKPHYYRIQGSTFLVEFDNTQGNANHIHTVWRDFDGDFGRDLIREHYQNSHH